MPPDKFKLLGEIRSRKNNVRANELKKLMSLFDFTYRNAKHCIIYKHTKYPSIRAMVTEHKEKGQENRILKCYVNNCITAIEELSSMEKGEWGQ